MNHSLAAWKDELLRKFRLNRFEAMMKAEELVLRFEDSTMTLS